MTNRDTSTLKIVQPPQTLREIALEQMRAAILAGQFKSGERLVERPLCEQLGVSRSVIRETIRYLEAEGLVEIVANKGPIVARLDWEQASQIYDIRMLLEQQAAETCARMADDSVKQDLQAALRALKDAYSAGKASQLIDATTAFYQVIFEACGQTIAWEIVQRLNGRISRLRAMTLGTRDRHAAGYARIEKIHDAICANQPDVAAQAIREHLTEAAAIAKTLLQEAPDPL